MDGTDTGHVRRRVNAERLDTSSELDTGARQR